MSETPTATAPNLHDGDAPGTPSIARLTLGIVLLLAIATADAFTPRVNLSVLYILPLILLFQVGVLRPVWRIVLILAILTYAIYFTKSLAFYQGNRVFSIRLLNRTLVVLMLLTVSQMLRLWSRSQAQRQDPELPDRFRRQEDKVYATLAIITSIAVAAAIATSDAMLPAYFNLAILYPVPLFISSWARSRLLVWSMLVVLLGLTAVGYIVGPAATHPLAHAPYLIINRCLAATATIVTAVVLDRWLSADQRVSV